MKQHIRDILVLGRAQSAAVELGLFPLAAWLGGAPWAWWPYFALLGLFSHLGSLGENTLSDIKYDRVDPVKADTPIVAGRMSMREGIAWVTWWQAMTIAMFGYLVLIRHAQPWVVMALAGYVGLGYLYNHYGKPHKLMALIAVSIGYGLLSLAMVGLWNGLVAWPLFAWSVTTVLFQIGISGEMKELAHPSEGNLLRALGTKVCEDGTMVVTWAVAQLAFWLTVAKLASIGWVTIWAGNSWWTFPSLLLAGGFYTWYATGALGYGSGIYDRNRAMRYIGAGEAGTYILLVVALAWAMPLWLAVYLIAGPVLFFVAMNRLLFVSRGTSKSAWAPGI